MTEDYSENLLKTFDLWHLFLHPKQFPYVGRCYAVARRGFKDEIDMRLRQMPEAKKVTDMSSRETIELFDIIVPEWDEAVKALFGHDWPNVAILGNEWPHLHAHLIPRYNTPRNFQGMEFVDPNPKGNYAPYPKKELPAETLIAIRDAMKGKLN